MQVSSPDSVIQTLQQMVRIDSVNGALTGKACAEAELCDWLDKTARAWGLKTRRLAVAGRADQLLVTHEVKPGTPGSPWLLFDSHMDTVAVDGMTIEPFGGELRDGRVYGRGACDTKGTGAAMLWALKQYAEHATGPNNIALLFGVDEEVGMVGVNAFLKYDYPKMGFVPAGVIVGEPTELHPVVAHNGLIRWQVTTHGIAAHSSVPHEGRSAISMMTRIVQAIEANYIPGLKAEHELTGHAACSINMIKGGSAPNIIPDRCVIDVDRRVVPGEDFQTVNDALAKVIEGVKQGEPGLAYSIDVTTTHPPLLPSDDSWLLTTATRVLKDLGLPKLSLGAPFSTHAGYFCEAGLPSIVLGPGEAHKAHTKDEFISTDQLERGVEVYLGLMRAKSG
jgi:acetylornithine deacetylase/succinyl-diaminopimelate desuccinylase-like protein